MNKETFIKWHGEQAWIKLCSPLYSKTSPVAEKIREAISIPESRVSTIEEYVHIYQIQPLLFLLGLKGNRATGLLASALKVDDTIKRIFLTKDHHGYYHVKDISTGENLSKTCLEILEENYNNDYYAVGYSEKELEDRKPEIPKKRVEEMKDGYIKSFLMDAWHQYAAAVTSKLRRERRLEMIKKVLKDKDGEGAFRLLEEDNDSRSANGKYYFLNVGE